MLQKARVVKGSKVAVAGGAIVLDHRSRGAQKGIMACVVVGKPAANSRSAKSP